jgi:hypothetical protein
MVFSTGGDIIEAKVLWQRGEAKYSIAVLLSTPQSKVVMQMVKVGLTLVTCVYSPDSYWMGVGMISYCSCHTLLDKE